MSLARDLIARVLFPDRDVHAIPVLDGGFAPNQRLEAAEALAEFQAPDALTLDPSGQLYISSGTRIFVCKGAGFAFKRVFAEFAAPVGALAWHAGRLLACIGGEGVRLLSATGETVAELREAGGEPLHCATAVAAADDGTVFITDGSRHNRAEQWLRDLMQNRAPSGRLIAWHPERAEARVLADQLAWPAGVAPTQDQSALLVTEAWTHRLSSFARTGGRARLLVRNFAGYPGRIARASTDGGVWIAFFALRTQLTEFVLREPAFRERMMAQVPPELWIGPTLGGRFDVREPTQIGRIKKLGIQKPWAPARSYGLVARLDETGFAVESLHSRAAGTLHGITAAIEHDGTLLCVSTGHGKLAAAALGGGG